jgi:hypothetical protein
METVIQVFPRNDFKVYVYFSDGTIKLFDMSHLIGKGVFQKISNVKDFTDKCTVLNGTLAWDFSGKFDGHNCIDIAPETVYANGQDVIDPLKNSAA